MPITPTHIAIALGQPAPATDSTLWAQWEQWIGDAHLLIEARAETVNVQLNSIDQVKIDYVIREAVAAHARHPDGATQVTISVDDAQTSRSYRSGHGTVTILPEWWTLLGLTDTAGAFHIDTVTRAQHNPIREWLSATDTTW